MSIFDPEYFLNARAKVAKSMTFMFEIAREAAEEAEKENRIKYGTIIFELKENK